MHSKPLMPSVAAVVTEIRPTIGLAYATSHDGADWTLTRSTRGAGLHVLTPGQRVDLTIAQHDAARFVVAYVIPGQ
jgi:hypothetical protein